MPQGIYLLLLQCVLVDLAVLHDDADRFDAITRGRIKPFFATTDNGDIFKGIAVD